MFPGDWTFMLKLGQLQANQDTLVGHWENASWTSKASCEAGEVAGADLRGLRRPFNSDWEGL